MPNVMRLTSVALSLALLAAPVLAADREDAGKTGRIHNSAAIENKNVTNGNGEILGHVEDFVVNVKNGQIVYVAVASGETLGFGGKLFAVPPDALRPSADGNFIVWDAKLTDLEAAKGFDANRWPLEPDARWATGTARRPENAQSKEKPEQGDKDVAAHLARLSSLRLPVRNEQGDTLGTVRAFGLDCENAKVAYAVMAYGGLAGVGSKYFAIPCDALEMKAPDLRQGARVYILNAKPADFESAPGFDYTKFPQQADAKFSKTDRKN